MSCGGLWYFGHFYAFQEDFELILRKKPFLKKIVIRYGEIKEDFPFVDS